MSCKIIDRFSNLLSSEEIVIVKNIVMGRMPSCYRREGSLLCIDCWMYEIVSNPSTSIDVDKFDYFQRDSKYANVRTTFDPLRFFYGFKIMNGHFAYSLKELHNIYEMYHTRYVLFKTVYYHKASVQIDCMILDIFDELVDILNLKDLSVDKFLQLTDDIIYRYDTVTLDRLNKRQLYKVVWNSVFCNDESYKRIFSLTTAYPELNENVFISKKKINFTSNENPLNKILFYDSTDVFTIKDMKKTMLMNENFEEIVIRVVAKDNFKEVRKKVLQHMKGIDEIIVQYK